MMVFWIINSRPSWSERLLKFDPRKLDSEPQTDPDFNKWESDFPTLVEAFNDNGVFNRVAWNQFFRKANGVMSGGFMQMAMADIHKATMKEWVPMLDPDCPADEAIDLMLQAVFARIGS
jgi:hypothetical protein